MQRSEVDLVIVGTDRTTYTGDVANKIGTYLKALAAKANDSSVLRCAAFVLDRLENARRIEGNSDRTTWRGEVKNADGWCDGQQIASELRR
jgi:Predicted translation initiation factor 2B subunit, eIF-2B alpha/beta/delta family